jgi:hypothetical protein
MHSEVPACRVGKPARGGFAVLGGKDERIFIAARHRQRRGVTIKNEKMKIATRIGWRNRWLRFGRGFRTHDAAILLSPVRVGARPGVFFPGTGIVKITVSNTSRQNRQNGEDDGPSECEAEKRHRLAFRVLKKKAMSSAAKNKTVPTRSRGGGKIPRFKYW